MHCIYAKKVGKDIGVGTSNVQFRLIFETFYVQNRHLEGFGIAILSFSLI